MRVFPSGKRTDFESVYSAVVLFKGVDGLIELLLGAVLLLARDPVRQSGGSEATELAEGTSAFRRLLRFSPWAIGLLGVLLIVQVTDALAAASVGPRVLSALDLVVLLLVMWEYRRLRAEHSAATATPAGVCSRG